MLETLFYNPVFATIILIIVCMQGANITKQTSNIKILVTTGSIYENQPSMQKLETWTCAPVFLHISVLLQDVRLD
jgi:hypothetical protein